MGASFAVLALLAVALLGIVLGFVTGTLWWFVLALVATAGAGVLLFRSRDRIAAPARRSADAAGTPDMAEPPDDPDAEAPVWVVDGRPRYHREDCELVRGEAAEPVPLSQAVEDGFERCPVCEPDTLDSPRVGS